MKKGLVEIQLKLNYLEALVEIYEYLTVAFEPTNPHELLLKAHIVSLHDRLKKLADREQKKNLLSLSPVETLAFVQLWERQPVALGKIFGQAIKMIIDKLDKTVKTPKHRYELQ